MIEQHSAKLHRLALRIRQPLMYYSLKLLSGCRRMLIIINWPFGMRFAVLSNLGRLAFSKYGVGLYLHIIKIAAPRDFTRARN